jgi:hypothetical protein
MSVQVATPEGSSGSSTSTTGNMDAYGRSGMSVDGDRTSNGAGSGKYWKQPSECSSGRDGRTGRSRSSRRRGVGERKGGRQRHDEFAHALTRLQPRLRLLMVLA